MKQTRRAFSTNQKHEIALRDGVWCVLKCGRRGNDFDHAFRLSTYLPFIEETWNGNVLCRQCHEEVTNPDTAEKWYKSLQVIQLALWRLYRVHPNRKDYKPHHDSFRSRMGRFFMIYPKEALAYYPNKMQL